MTGSTKVLSGFEVLGTIASVDFTVDYVLTWMYLDFNSWCSEKDEIRIIRNKILMMQATYVDCYKFKMWRMVHLLDQLIQFEIPTT